MIRILICSGIYLNVKISLVMISYEIYRAKIEKKRKPITYHICYIELNYRNHKHTPTHRTGQEPLPLVIISLVSFAVSLPIFPLFGLIVIASGLGGGWINQSINQVLW